MRKTAYITVDYRVEFDDHGSDRPEEVAREHAVNRMYGFDSVEIVEVTVSVDD